MSGSQFWFLEEEFPDEFGMAEWAERHAMSDPGPAVIYARKCLETAVKWVYAHDRSLPEPYDNKLNTYLSTPAFKALADGLVFRVARKIQLAGNKAVHESKPPTDLEAVEVISSLFLFCKWLGYSYGREVKPDPSVKFDPRRLRSAARAPQKSLAERQQLDEDLAEKAEQEQQARERLAAATHTVEELDAERRRLLAEVAAAKKVAQALPIEAQDWSEQETRRFKIDRLLAEAGWSLANKRDREYEVQGMPTESGVGQVDYVLWGDDGLPLALVEAKRSIRRALDRCPDLVARARGPSLGTADTAS